MPILNLKFTRQRNEQWYPVDARAALAAAGYTRLDGPALTITRDGMVYAWPVTAPRDLTINGVLVSLEPDGELLGGKLDNAGLNKVLFSWERAHLESPATGQNADEWRAYASALDGWYRSYSDALSQEVVDQQAAGKAIDVKAISKQVTEANPRPLPPGAKAGAIGNPVDMKVSVSPAQPKKERGSRTAPKPPKAASGIGTADA